MSPETVEKFGTLMRERILDSDTPARKSWIGAIIDRIEVDQDTVRLFGRKDVLEHAVTSGGQLPQGVRTYVPKWRSLRESNPSFQIENLAQMVCV